MVLTCINQKGGVGKTTTVANLGVYLAHLGKKVLLIDLDPQSNLSSGLQAIRRSNQDEIGGFARSVYDVMLRRHSINEVFVSTAIANLFIVPSSIELAGAEVELVAALSRETILRNALAPIRDQYDYILIDCPPSLGILPVNAMVAADRILIPVQCEYYALEGLSQLIKTIELIRNNINHDLMIGGVILTMHDPRTNLSKEIAEEVRKFFGKQVFDTIVPRNIRLSEAPSYGKPIKIYDPHSTGAQAYEKLAQELIAKTA